MKTAEEDLALSGSRLLVLNTRLGFLLATARMGTNAGE